MSCFIGGLSLKLAESVCADCFRFDDIIEENGDVLSGCFDLKTSDEPAVLTRVGCFLFKENSKRFYRNLQSIVRETEKESMHANDIVNVDNYPMLSNDLFVDMQWLKGPNHHILSM